ncbi:8187_t:CDS:1, partial [Gigaspora rosea]
GRWRVNIETKRANLRERKEIKAALKHKKKMDFLNMLITMDKVIDNLTSLNFLDADPLPPPFDPMKGTLFASITLSIAYKDL